MRKSSVHIPCLCMPTFCRFLISGINFVLHNFLIYQTPHRTFLSTYITSDICFIIFLLLQTIQRIILFIKIQFLLIKTLIFHCFIQFVQSKNRLFNRINLNKFPRRCSPWTDLDQLLYWLLCCLFY